ncbi:MAG: SH3 domain-containing protein [Hyphomicrobiaceae bacterium]
MRIAPLLVSYLALVVSGAQASAEADGPDAWRVTGVRAGDKLNMHAQASVRSRIILVIPHNATALKNGGCKGGPTFAEWQKMSAVERKRASRNRWCRVTFKGKTGWVAGRFLAEASAGEGASTGVSVGPWRLSCDGSVCAMEQDGIATAKRTTFRVQPTPDGNARISIVRSAWPKEGALSIYMDGDEIMQGAIAPLLKGADRIVLDRDDLSLGLMRQMARHKNMVLSFPGEKRGVEFRVEAFATAKVRLESLAKERGRR